MRTGSLFAFLFCILPGCTSTQVIPSEAEPLAEAAFENRAALVAYLEASGVEVASAYGFYTEKANVVGAFRMEFLIDGSTCTVYTYETAEAAQALKEDAQRAGSTRAIPDFVATPQRTTSYYTVASIRFGANVTACPAGRSGASRAFQALAEYGDANDVTAGLAAPL